MKNICLVITNIKNFAGNNRFTIWCWTVFVSYQIVKKNSNPSPLKGILVKHKNSKSLSSLVTAAPALDTRDQCSSSSAPRLNRASLHLPLTSHHVSPPQQHEPGARYPDHSKTVARMDQSLHKQMIDHKPNNDDSFTWSEIGVQTEVNYE